MLASSPAALNLFVSRLAVASPDRDSLWSSLFSPVPEAALLLRLLDAVTESGLAGELPSAQLDEHVKAIAAKLFAPESRYSDDELELVRRVALQPQPLVTPTIAQEVVALAADALAQGARLALRSEAERTLPRMTAPSSVLAHYTQIGDNARSAFDIAGVAVATFDLGHAVPLLAAEDDEREIPGETIAAAQQTWAAIVRAVGDPAVELVLQELQSRLHDGESAASAVEVVGMTAELLDTYPQSAHSLGDVLPRQAELAEAFEAVAPNPPSPSLAILDPLVPVAETAPSSASSTFDRSFLSPYARGLVAVLEVSARNHASLRQHAGWLLPHLLFLADVARDELAKPTPPTKVTGLFAPDVPAEVLARVGAAADGASSYLLSTMANAVYDGWHAAAVAHLRAKELPEAPEKDRLLFALDFLWRRARVTEQTDVKALYAQRAVRTVLSSVLRYSEEDGGRQDAERWLALAQSLASPGAFA